MVGQLNAARPFGHTAWISVLGFQTCSGPFPLTLPSASGLIITHKIPRRTSAVPLGNELRLMALCRFNPNGIASLSPGLPRMLSGLPWVGRTQCDLNPNGVASVRHRAIQPFQGYVH